MEKPQFNGDLNAYIERLCLYADGLRGAKRNTQTVSLDVHLTIFGVAGKKPVLASVAELPVALEAPVNMGVYRKILERKNSLLEHDNALKQKRIEELETMFAEELRALEEKEWERDDSDEDDDV